VNINTEPLPGGIGDTLRWDGPTITLEVVVKPEDGVDYSARAKCMWRGQEIKAQMPVWLNGPPMREDEKQRLFSRLLSQAAQCVKDQVRMRELGLFVAAPA
jgi:hypothetical protein